MAHPEIPTRPSDAEELNALADERVLSGRYVVLGVFAFALLMVGSMFLYWELYTRPFRPLQAAIAARYKYSSPRAIGGKHKSHLPGAPNILRLIVRIDWDPRGDEPRCRMMSNDLIDIARKTIELDSYDRVEIYLMHRRAERATITWSVDAPRTAFPLPGAGPLAAGVTRDLTEGDEDK